MKSISYILIIFTFLFLSSCKNEPKVLDESSSIEDIYFSDYEAPDEKWGYMDMSGETVIKPKYDDVRDMKSNITAANLNGRWGYIDQSGKTVIDFIYKQVLDFNEEEDRAIVQDFSNNWILIDADNKIIDSLEYQDYKSFSGSYCPVAYAGQWGLIDRDGNEIIKPAFGSIKIIGGSCIVKRDDKYGIIAIDGKELMPFNYDRIDVNDNSILRVKSKGQYAFYDMNTYQKISPEYANASKMEDGYFVVNDKSGKFTIINKQFKTVIEIEADKVEYANENLWKYKRNGLWGLIDISGNQITPPKYELMNKFQEGYILYSVDDKWGYIDTKGEVFIPAELPLAWDFKDGLARVFHSKGVGFFNKDKVLVIDKRIFEVRDFYNGLARYQTM